MKKPIIVAKITEIELSFFIKIPVIPVKKANIPKIAARSPGIASIKLVKNSAPPRWPEKIRSCNIVNDEKKAMMNPTDHFPKKVLGIKFNLMLCNIVYVK